MGRLSGADAIRIARGMLFGIPAAVLGISYLLLAIRYQEWNVFPVVVHENGQLTLLDTVFYFRHFLRELPVCVFLAAAISIAGIWHTPLANLNSTSLHYAKRLKKWIGFGLVAAVAIVLAIVWNQDGLGVVYAELMQAHTRGDSREFGSHWRYHWLHLVEAMPFSIGLAMVLRGLTGGAPRNRDAMPLAGVWVIAFLFVTFLAGSPLAAFTDPLHLAHQIREIETHRLLTIALALGTLWILERRLEGASGGYTSRLLVRGIILISIATLIPLWIIWKLRHVDVLSLAQRESSFFELAAAHHFEHCLDYIFVSGLTAWLYLFYILRQPSNKLAQ